MCVRGWVCVRGCVCVGGGVGNMGNLRKPYSIMNKFAKHLR